MSNVEVSHKCSDEGSPEAKDYEHDDSEDIEDEIFHECTDEVSPNDTSHVLYDEDDDVFYDYSEYKEEDSDNESQVTMTPHRIFRSDSPPPPQPLRLPPPIYSPRTLLLLIILSLPPPTPPHRAETFPVPLHPLPHRGPVDDLLTVAVVYRVRRDRDCRAEDERGKSPRREEGGSPRRRWWVHGGSRGQRRSVFVCLGLNSYVAFQQQSLLKDSLC